MAADCVYEVNSLLSVLSFFQKDTSALSYESALLDHIRRSEFLVLGIILGGLPTEEILLSMAFLI